MKSSIVAIISAAAIIIDPAAAAGYLKLGDIKGESTEAAHKDWINLLSVSQSVSRPDSGATGTTRVRAAAVGSPIVIEKALSKASPKLVEAVAKGNVFKDAEIHLTQSGGRQNAPYYTIKLTNVRVTSYDISGDADDRPTEAVSLSYDAAIWTYGAGPGAVESSHNFRTGQ